MSDNDEVILGFCPLPEVQEDVPGNTPENTCENGPESNGATSSSPLEESEGEVITDEIREHNSNQVHLDSYEVAEHKPVFEHQTDPPELRPDMEEEAHGEEFKPIIQNEQNTQDNTEESNDLSSSNAVVEDESERVTVSSSIVDFLNRANAEFAADTTLDDDESERPAKKKRKTLPKGTFHCAECRIQCEDFDDYASHMNSHSDVPLYTCPKCLYIFQDQNLYEAHTAQTCKAAGNAKDKECAVCRKNFKYDSHLREHIICMHNKSPLFSCPICAQNITSWRRSIDRHMANHVNNNKCPACGAKGESTDAFDAHLIEKGENHLHCKSCDYVSSFRVDFFNHVNVHIPKVDVLEPMVCFKCSHRFQRTAEFNNHVRFFCKLRDADAADTEQLKVEEVPAQPQPQPQQQPPPPQATIQLSVPESINNVQEQNTQLLQIANDPSKQIITLPDGVNNNAFIPITVSTGNDEHGTTVILIPQILLMPNSGVVSQDGTQPEVLGTGQNDQVIYLECLKPEHSGMMPLFEIPMDKSVQENIYNNHLSQAVVQAVQPLQGLQSVQAVQTLQGMQQVQAVQQVQTMQQMQNVHQVQTVQQVQPMQQIQQVQAVQQAQQVQAVQQAQQVQAVQQAQQVQAMQQLQQVQAVQQAVQALQTLQAAESVQTVQSVQPVQTIQTSEQPLIQNIKEEPQDNQETCGTVDVKPPISIEATSAPTMSAQNVFSLALTPTTSGAPIDSVNEQMDTDGPPALVCSVCNEVLKDSETYESHVKQHEKVKSKPKPAIVVPRKVSSAFKCDQCGQGFAAKHHLEQHTITFHSDVAGIVCPVCRVGMASEKTSLNEHLAKAHKLRVEPSGKLTDCTGS